MPFELELKYGCNPHQDIARLAFAGETCPLEILNGRPSYISILDALSAWQTARELKRATGIAGASSFKHVSPAGAAIGTPLSPELREVYMIDPEIELTPLARAYARARGADRLSSFGDIAGLSEVCDEATARLLKPEVADIVIAPDYEPAALEILKAKKKGGFIIFKIDPDYEPPELETRQFFGFELTQRRNEFAVGPQLLENVVTDSGDFPGTARRDLLVATCALKFTQSNSVTVAYDGQVIGNGAGQQSRVHCVRLACAKADKWMLQQHPRVRGLRFAEGLKRPEKINAIDQYLLYDELSPPEIAELQTKIPELPEPLTAEERLDWIKSFEGVALSSDAFFPFRDNLDRASRSGVKYILQPGGSVRDDVVIEAANQYGMAMAFSGARWFLH